MIIIQQLPHNPNTPLSNKPGFFILQGLILCIFCITTIMMMSQWFARYRQAQLVLRKQMHALMLMNRASTQEKSLYTSEKINIIVRGLQSYSFTQPVAGFTLTKLSMPIAQGKRIDRFVGVLDE